MILIMRPILFNNIIFLTSVVSLSLTCPSYAMKRAYDPCTDPCTEPWEIFVNEILEKKTELKLHWQDEDDDDRGDNGDGDLSLSLLSNNDILGLAKAIKSKDKLTHFALSCDCCGNKGAFALADAVGSLRNLTYLFLELWPDNTSLDAQGTKAILNAIKSLPLNKLKLNLPMDDDSSEILGEIIEHNNTLESLYLQNLNCKEGAYFILAALADNKNITILEFFFVDSQSMMALAEVIRNNSTITTLEIGCDEGVIDFSFRALVCAIAVNKTLSTLSLPFINYNFDDEYIDRRMQIITNAIKSYKTLTTLDIPFLYTTIKSWYSADHEIRRLSFLNQIQPILDKNKAWPNIKFIAFAMGLEQGKFIELPSEIRQIILQKFSLLCGALSTKGLL